MKLYDGKNKTGLNYEKGRLTPQQIAEIEAIPDTFERAVKFDGYNIPDKYADQLDQFPKELVERCEAYMVIGTYFGWSWQEFEKTPYPVIRILKILLDKKFENWNTGFISYTHLSLLLAMTKMVPKKD